MRGTGETGPAPEGYATRSDYSQPPGPQSQTDSEKAESQRQAALRHAPLHGLPTNNTDPVKFRRYPVLNADDNIETKKAPPAEVQLGGNPATPTQYQAKATAQADHLANPNDNQAEAVTRSECDAGAEAAKAQEQITEDNLVPLLAAKKLNGSQPLEQYDATQNDITQIDPANANTPSVRPTAVSPTFENMPAELKALPNWLMWRYLPPGRAGQKWRKVPFQTNGKYAKANDNSTWTTFEACRAAYDHGGFDGIGFVFTGEVGADGLCIVGIDFDHCIEGGKLLEPARSRIAQLRTYTEISVSGEGIHCFARAKPGTTVKYTSTEPGHSVEVYSSIRYFTATGVPFGGTCGTIRAAATEVDALVKEARAKSDPNPLDVGGQKAASSADLYVDPALAEQGPAASAIRGETETIGEGIKDHWFDKLAPEQKDEAVYYMLSGIAAKTKVFELGENGGNNDDWFKLITALAVSGAPHAEDYFVEFASKVENADSEEELRWKFKTCQKDANANKAQADGLEIITVGTLLKYAYEAGADLSPWRSQVEVATGAITPVAVYKHVQLGQRAAA